MRGARRVFLSLILLAVALAVLVFVLENQQEATVAFLGWSTSKMPLSVFVVSALVVGMVIGPVFGRMVRQKARRD